MRILTRKTNAGTGTSDVVTATDDVVNTATVMTHTSTSNASNLCRQRMTNNTTHNTTQNTTTTTIIDYANPNTIPHATPTLSQHPQQHPQHHTTPSNNSTTDSERWMASLHTNHRGRVDGASRFDHTLLTNHSDLTFSPLAWRNSVRELLDSACPPLAKVAFGRSPAGIKGVERSTFFRFLWLWELPQGPWRVEGKCERMDLPKHSDHPWQGLVIKLYEVAGASAITVHFQGPSTVAVSATNYFLSFLSSYTNLTPLERLALPTDTNSTIQSPLPPPPPPPTPPPPINHQEFTVIK